MSSENKEIKSCSKKKYKAISKGFCFQLTKEENETLKCHIGAAKILDEENKDTRGGRWTLSYVFNEQGILMLASVLHRTAVNIMGAFVEMRCFIPITLYSLSVSEAVGIPKTDR